MMVDVLGFPSVQDIVDQIRITLQDTDDSATSGFRYPTNDIVRNLNMGVLEMFRIRPDIFLEVGLKPFAFTTSGLTAPFPIEPQWVPPLVYYVVGFTQLRDDEPEQDQRASMFLAKFTSMLVAVA